MNRSSLYKLLLLTMAALTCNGCRKPAQATAPTPPAIHAAVSLADVAAALGSFQAVEISLHTQGLIADPTHRQIEKALEQVGKDGAALARLVSIGGTERDVQAAAAALSTEIRTDLNTGVLGVNDVQTRARLSMLTETLAASVEGISLVYTTSH